MAQKTIPELSAISEVELTTLVPVDSGTQTYKATIQQIADALPPAVLSEFVESDAMTGNQDSTSSGTLGDLDNLEVEIETDGNTPVWVGLQPDLTLDESSSGRIELQDAGSAALGIFSISRTTSSVETTFPYVDFQKPSGGTACIPPGVIWIIDVPPAGTHLYKLRFGAYDGGTLVVIQSKLVAFKLAPIN